MGEDPDRTGEDAPTPPGGTGPDWPTHMGLWLALIPLRAVAMVACATVLVLPVNWVARAVLPSPGGWDDSFERLGLVLIVSAVAGIALGAVLTHPLGRKKLHPEARWWGSLIAVILIALVGLLVISF